MWGYLKIIKNILLPWCVFKAWPTFDGQQFIDLFNDTKAQSKSIISLEAALKRNQKDVEAHQECDPDSPT